MRCWEGKCRCGCGEADVAGGVRGLVGLETGLVRLLAAMLHSWRARELGLVLAFAYSKPLF